MQEQLTGLLGSVLFPLVAVPNAPRQDKRHRVNGVGDQVGPHVIVKGQTQDLTRAVPQSKATADFRSIGEADLQDVGKDHFRLGQIEVFLLQFIGAICAAFPGYLYFFRLRRAAIPYVRITHITRFFPVPSNLASLRCPIVSSFS